jgi:hypothetical protein
LLCLDAWIEAPEDAIVLECSQLVGYCVFGAELLAAGWACLKHRGELVAGISREFQFTAAQSEGIATANCGAGDPETNKLAQITAANNKTNLQFIFNRRSNYSLSEFTNLTQSRPLAITQPIQLIVDFAQNRCRHLREK